MVMPETKSPPAEQPPAAPTTDSSLPLAIAGTVAGAALGALAFWGLLKYNFYAIMLPGLLAGLGGGYPLKRRMIAVGLFAAVVGLVTMVLAEWANRPFVKDESLTFFVTHLHHLNRGAILMMVLGVAAALWFGMGREHRS